MKSYQKKVIDKYLEGEQIPSKLYYLDNILDSEELCISFFAEMQLGEDLHCPYCTKMLSRRYRIPKLRQQKKNPYLFKCSNCKSDYRPRAKTIFKRFRTPINILLFMYYEYEKPKTKETYLSDKVYERYRKRIPKTTITNFILRMNEFDSLVDENYDKELSLALSELPPIHNYVQISNHYPVVRTIDFLLTNGGR